MTKIKNIGVKMKSEVRKLIAVRRTKSNKELFFKEAIGQFLEIQIWSYKD